MPRPALLLAVDGILNPYGAAECPQGFTEYDLFSGDEPVRLCPAHGGRAGRAPVAKAFMIMKGFTCYNAKKFS